MRDPDELWTRCDFADCPEPLAYYVEWDEMESGQVAQFGGLYCNAHTTAIRGGWSPFEEWGSTPMVRLVRSGESHRALCEAARTAVEQAS